jgi:hypothetical protein
MKQDGENPSYMSSEEIMVGSKEIMTHAQRQAFLKTSYLGKLLGVAHLLPEVIEVTEEKSENLPHLKRVRGLFKSEEQKDKQYNSNNTEVAKHGN